MSLRPGISYGHVLRELSVNRDDPCEIVRELISNSYDAGATEIRYYPIMDRRGFIFWDNGEGMSLARVANGVSAYQAFFSIGLSTRPRGGHYIGYKCQGSKLCFACETFALITRCAGERKWRYKAIDDPRRRLSDEQENDITPQKLLDPWNELRRLVGTNPHLHTVGVLDHLNERFFRETFRSGAMIVVLGLDLTQEEFGKHFSTTDDEGIDLSYLYNYVRLATRHGDVRLLGFRRDGFPATQAERLRPPPQPLRMSLWIPDGRRPRGDGEPGETVVNELQEVPQGFWYLEPPRDDFRTPRFVHRLDDARFCARLADRFTLPSGDPYAWILAIDGHRKAQDGYYCLDRQGRGGNRSGYGLRKVRGCYLAAGGIKVAEIPDFFKQFNPYDILADPQTYKHYLFILHGPFELVANRNGVTATDLGRIKSDDFRMAFQQSLERTAANAGNLPDLQISHRTVLDELLVRLQRTIQEMDLNRELNKIEAFKQELPRRGMFRINSGILQRRAFLYPEINEENWVGSLYGMLSLLVEANNPMANLWVRPVNMMGVSIDALALPLHQNDFIPKDFVGVEYKFRFSRSAVFNHPLCRVDYIVCWEFEESLDALGTATQVQDMYSCVGDAQPPHTVSRQGNPIAYEIARLREIGRPEPFNRPNIRVVCLKELIRATFDAEFFDPVPAPVRAQRGRGN